VLIHQVAAERYETGKYSPVKPPTIALMKKAQNALATWNQPHRFSPFFGIWLALLTAK
jgi:hypothetical protein